MSVPAPDASLQAAQPFALARHSARIAAYTRSILPQAGQLSTTRVSAIVMPIRVSNGSISLRGTPDFSEMHSAHSGRGPSRIATDALLSGIPASAVARTEHNTTGGGSEHRDFGRNQNGTQQAIFDVA
jgi:hypothetical protein